MTVTLGYLRLRVLALAALLALSASLFAIIQPADAQVAGLSFYATRDTGVANNLFIVVNRTDTSEAASYSVTASNNLNEPTTVASALGSSGARSSGVDFTVGLSEWSVTLSGLAAGSQQWVCLWLGSGGKPAGPCQRYTPEHIPAYGAISATTPTLRSLTATWDSSLNLESGVDAAIRINRGGWSTHAASSIQPCSAADVTPREYCDNELSATAVTASVDRLEPNTRYWVGVFNRDGTAWRPVAGGAFTTPPLPTPRISNESTTGFRVEWNAIVGIGNEATRVRVTQGSTAAPLLHAVPCGTADNREGTTAFCQSVNGTAQNVSGLRPDTTYHVALYQRQGTSDWLLAGQTTAITEAERVIPTAEVTAFTASGFNLRWNAPQGGTGQMRIRVIQGTDLDALETWTGGNLPCNATDRAAITACVTRAGTGTGTRSYNLSDSDITAGSSYVVGIYQNRDPWTVIARVALTVPGGEPAGAPIIVTTFPSNPTAVGFTVGWTNNGDRDPSTDTRVRVNEGDTSNLADGTEPCDTAGTADTTSASCDVVESNLSSFIVTGLVSGTEYYVAVYQNLGAAIGWVPIADGTATTLGEAPEPPEVEMARITSETPTGFTVSWTPESNFIQNTSTRLRVSLGNASDLDRDLDPCAPADTNAAYCATNIPLLGSSHPVTGLLPATIYYVVVYQRLQGIPGWTPIATRQTATRNALPPTVQDATTSVGHDSITVGWTNSPDRIDGSLTRVRHRRSSIQALVGEPCGPADNAFNVGCVSPHVAANLESVVVTGLFAETVYSIGVYQNLNGGRGWTLIAEATVTTTAQGSPPPLEPLMFGSITRTGFTVTWTNETNRVSGSPMTRVRYHTGTATNLPDGTEPCGTDDIAAGSATCVMRTFNLENASISGLTAGTDYYVSVYQNLAAPLGWTLIAAGTRATNDPPVAPPVGDATTDDIRDTRLEIGWTDDVNKVQFTNNRIRYHLSSASLDVNEGDEPCGATDNARPGVECLLNVGGNSRLVLNLMPGTEYYFAVYQDLTDLGYTKIAEVTVTTMFPPVPTPQTATTPPPGVQATSVNVGWNNVDNRVANQNTRVRVNTGSTDNINAADLSDPCGTADDARSGVICVTALPDATSQSVTDLTAGTAYYVTVYQNLRGHGWSLIAQRGFMTTTVVAPTIETATVGTRTETSAHISWNNNDDRTGSTILRTNTGDRDTFPDTGVPCDTTDRARSEVASCLTVPTGFDGQNVANLTAGTQYTTTVYQNLPVLGYTPIARATYMTAAAAPDPTDVMVDNITQNSAQFTWSNADNRVASSSTRIRVNQGDASNLGDGVEPCGGSDPTGTRRCETRSPGDTTYTRPNLSAFTGYYVGIYQELQVHGWTLIAEATFTTTTATPPTVQDLTFFSTQYDRFGVRWNNAQNRLDNRTWVRVNEGSVTNIAPDIDPCGVGGDDADSAARFCTSSNSAAVTQTTVTFRSPETEYYVGVWQNLGGGLGWTLIAEDTVTTTVPPTTGVTFSNQTHHSFRAAWGLPSSGRNGDVLTRITTGAAGAPLAADGVPCSTDDAAQDAVECFRGDQNNRNRNIGGLSPDTQYHVGIWATVGGNLYLVAQGTQRTNAAPAPNMASFPAADVSATGFRVTWPAYAGGIGDFQVRLSEGNTATAVPSGEDPCSNDDAAQGTVTCVGKFEDATSHTFSSLSANTAYHVGVWRLVGTTWVLIAQGTQTTDEAALPATAPVVTASTGAGCGELDVTWTANADADSFTVTWGSGGTFTTSDGTARSYQITGLTGGSSVTVTVTVNGGTSTTLSHSDTATVGGGCPRPSVSVTSGTGCGNLTISWTGVTGATGYEVAWSASPSGETGILPNTSTSTIRSPNGLLPRGETITITVTVRGGPSEGLTGSDTGTAGPNCPSPSVTVTGGTGCGDLGVSWTAVSGATGYTLTWPAQGTSSGTHTVSSGAAGSHSITGLTPGASVTVTVAVVGGISAGLTGSNTATAGNTNCPADPVVTASGTGCGDIFVSWTFPNTDATNFTVTWTPAGTTSGTHTTASGTTPSYTITGLSGGASVMVTVTVNGGTSGTRSHTVSATAGNTGCAPTPSFPGTADISALTHQGLTVGWSNADGRVDAANTIVRINTGDMTNLDDGAVPCSGADSTDSVVCVDNIAPTLTERAWPTGLDAVTQYYVGVYQNLTDGGWTLIAEATPMTNAAPAPAVGSVTISNPSDTGFTATWPLPGRALGVTAVRVHAGTSADYDLSTAGSITVGPCSSEDTGTTAYCNRNLGITATNDAVTGLTAETEYFVGVYQFLNMGTGWSLIASTTITTEAAVSAPDIAEATITDNTTGLSFTVGWENSDNRVSGAWTRVRINEGSESNAPDDVGRPCDITRGDPGANSLPFCGVDSVPADTSVSATGLSPNTQYYVGVWQNLTGLGWTVIAEATPMTGDLNNASVTDLSSTGFMITWTDASGLEIDNDVVRIRVNTGAAFDYDGVGDPCDTADEAKTSVVACVSESDGAEQATVGGLDANTQYYVAVYQNITGGSATGWTLTNGGPVRTLSPPAVPTVVTAPTSDITHDSFTLSWDNDSTSDRVTGTGTRIRVEPGDANTFTTGGTPCDATDDPAGSSLPFCNFVGPDVSTRTFSGILSASTEYYVSLWHRIDEIGWHQIAEATFTTMRGVTEIAETSRTATGFAIAWTNDADAMTGTNTRIRLNAGGSSNLGEGVEACGTADSGTDRECFTHALTDPRSQTFSGLESGTQYYVGVYQNLSGGLGWTQVAFAVATTRQAAPVPVDLSANTNPTTEGGVSSITATSFTVHLPPAHSLFVADQGTFIRVTEGSTPTAFAGAHECSTVDQAVEGVECRWLNFVTFQYDFTDLTPSTMYYISIVPNLSDGLGFVPTAFAVVTTADAPPPPTPTQITASGISQTGFTIDWTNDEDSISTDDTRIRVNPGGTETALASGADPCDTDDSAQSGVECHTVANATLTFSDTGLTAGSTYYVGVWQNLSGGVGWAKIAYSVVTTTDPAPTAPTPVEVATTVTSNSISISWTSHDDSTGTRLRVNTGSNSDLASGAEPCSASDTAVCNTALGASASSGTVSGLTANTGYYIAVWQNLGGTLGWQQIAYDTTTTNPPAPIELTPDTVSQTGFTIEWSNDPTAISTDDTRIRVNQGSTETVIASGRDACDTNDDALAGIDCHMVDNATLTFTDTGLAANTQYYVGVWQNLSDGVGWAKIAYATVTTDPADPTELTASGITQTGYTLEWTNDPTAINTDSTRIRVNPGNTETAIFSGSAPCGALDNGQTSVDCHDEPHRITTFTDTGLTAGSQYYVGVWQHLRNGVGWTKIAYSVVTTDPAPAVPPPPSEVRTSRVTHSEFDVTWDNHADRVSGGQTRVRVNQGTDSNLPVGQEPCNGTDLLASSNALCSQRNNAATSYTVMNLGMDASSNLIPLTPSTTYYVSIYQQLTGFDGWVELYAGTVTTTAAPPAPEQTITISTRTDSSVAIDWTGANHDNRSGLTRIRANAGSASDLASGAVPCSSADTTAGAICNTTVSTAATSDAISYLAPGTEYYIGVWQNLTANGDTSGWTMVAYGTATTDAAVPEARVTGIYDDGFIVSWDNPDGFTGVTVVRVNDDLTNDPPRDSLSAGVAPCGGGDDTWYECNITPDTALESHVNTYVYGDLGDEADLYIGVWQSTDDGATWTKIAGTTATTAAEGVTMPPGSDDIPQPPAPTPEPPAAPTHDRLSVSWTNAANADLTRFVTTRIRVNEGSSSNRPSGSSACGRGDTASHRCVAAGSTDTTATITRLDPEQEYFIEVFQYTSQSQISGNVTAQNITSNSMTLDWSSNTAYDNERPLYIRFNSGGSSNLDGTHIPCSDDDDDSLVCFIVPTTAEAILDMDGNVERYNFLGTESFRFTSTALQAGVAYRVGLYQIDHDYETNVWSRDDVADGSVTMGSWRSISNSMATTSAAPTAPTPNAAANLRAYDGSFCGDVLYTWDAIGSATSYQLSVRVDGSSTVVQSMTLSRAITSYRFSGLTAGSTYRIQFQAPREGSLSTVSVAPADGPTAVAGNTGCVSISGSHTTPPTQTATVLIRHSRVTCGELDVFWTVTSGADNYLVEVRPQGSGAWGAAIDVDATASPRKASFAGLTLRQPYQARVTARDINDAPLGTASVSEGVIAPADCQKGLEIVLSNSAPSAGATVTARVYPTDADGNRHANTWGSYTWAVDGPDGRIAGEAATTNGDRRHVGSNASPAATSFRFEVPSTSGTYTVTVIGTATPDEDGNTAQIARVVAFEIP